MSCLNQELEDSDSFDVLSGKLVMVLVDLGRSRLMSRGNLVLRIRAGYLV